MVARPSGGVIREVVIPLSMPGITIGTIFVVALALGDYSTVRLMSGGQASNAGLAISNMINSLQYPPAAANAVVLLVVTLAIESYYDEYLAIPHILAELIQHEAESDAFILACWGDPGIEAAREIIKKPVVGIAEASLYVANTLGAKFGVVSTLKRTQHMVEKTVEKVGLSSRCALALCTDLSVAATEEDRDHTVKVLEAGGRAVIAAGAEVIVLGCAGMSGLEQQLSERLGVPVVDAVAAAVVWAEALVQLGAQTSKAMTYRYPEVKPISGYPDFMQPTNLYTPS